MKKRSAYQTALNILSRRDHFRRELAEKLRKKDYPSDEIEQAVERCAAINLVDDERVGSRFVEIRAVDRGWGPHRLAAELKHRGVASHDAERMAQLSSEHAEAAMQTALRKLEIRAPEQWWRDSQRRARMVSSLITRGFETENAIAAIDDLAASREKQHHALDDQ